MKYLLHNKNVQNLRKSVQEHRAACSYTGNHRNSTDVGRKLKGDRHDRHDFENRSLEWSSDRSLADVRFYARGELDTSGE